MTLCDFSPLNVTIIFGILYDVKEGQIPSPHCGGGFFIGDDMKPIRCDLPHAENIEIVTFADEHIGDSNSDWKHLKDRIEYVEKTPNCYCVLNGDLIDAAIANSVGDIYGAELQPMEALKLCTKVFGGVAPKVLCCNPGNHEHRIYKTTGIDITELMCAQLGIAQKYSPTTAMLFIRFGDRGAKHHHRPILYTAYVTHGSGGGGRREGGKINKLADLASIVDCDIYIHSHTHLPAAFKETFFRISESNSSIEEVEKLFVNTASNLKYGGYGDTAGFKPASRTSPVIYLNGTNKDMYALV